MKGFGIYVKNNLLEPKHIENMAEAVWLYLWLLDKMTSVNEAGVGKVLGNKPVTYAEIYADLGIQERTYQRWVRKLRDAGYIRTLRAPYGLVITVNKAEKIFKKRPDTNVVTKKINRVVTTHKSGPVTTNMAHLSDKKVVSNKDNTVDNTKETTIVVRGKPEINEMFAYWAKECQYDIESRVKANRFACSNLLKKHGKEKLESLIRGVAMAQSDPYGPRIADFSELQSKTNQLVVWGKKKYGEELANEIIRI